MSCLFSKLYRVRVAHKNVPNFIMMLYCSTIEFKQKNNTLKEQSSLNSMRNYDIIRFCFDSEICKRVLGVGIVQNNQ